jgi:hypothetical protein
METKKVSEPSTSPSTDQARPCEFGREAPEQPKPNTNASDDRVVRPSNKPRQQAKRIEAELLRGLRPQVIEQIAVEELKPRRRNARQHSSEQIEQLAASLREFGFIGAIIIDETNQVLAGHGRLLGRQYS